MIKDDQDAIATPTLSSKTTPRLPIHGHLLFGWMDVFVSRGTPLRARAVNILARLRASCYIVGMSA